MQFKFPPGLSRMRRGPKKTNRLPTRVEELFYEGYAVTIERRPYSRRICLTVRVDGGVRVVVPATYPTRKVEEYVLEAREWIEHRIAIYKKTREKYPMRLYREGEVFPLLGKKLTLRYIEGTDARIVSTPTEIVVHVGPEKWKTFDPNTAHPEVGKKIVEAYKKLAIGNLTERIWEYAMRMKVYPGKLSFRTQKTRWGSCTAKGDIAINWKLIVAPIEVIDYVLVHELAHLRHFNHSPAFWSFVATEAPKYEECKEWLKNNQYAGDFLAKRSELYR